MFDGISDFLGSDSFANAVPFVGPILNYFGQDKANKQAQANAELQMQFQEYMSSTAYQRAVKDLEKAGLNPMLAYMRGGAGAGGASGAMAQPQSTTRDAVSSAVSGFQASNLRMQNKLLEAQIAKTAAESAESVSRTNLNIENEELVRKQQGHSVASADELRARTGLHGQHVENAMAEFYRIVADTQLKGAERNRVLELAQNAVEERKLTIEKTGIAHIDAILKKLEIPLARNLAKAEGTWFKENVSPFMPDFGVGTRGYRSLRGYGR